MKNKRVLIIINDYMFLRNYIQSKVFQNLIDNEKYRIEFLINNSINIKKKDFENCKFTLFNYTKKKNKYFLKLFQRKIWQNINYSSSFRFKLKIYLQFNKYLEAHNEGIKDKILKFPARTLSFLFNYINFYFDTLKIFYPFRFVQEKKIKINSTLLSKIKNFNPDLIILPTNTINPIKYDLFRISKIIKLKILYLVDNWDNLSSKSTIFSKEGIFTVWGKQTLNHARKIQGIKRKNIEILGTPRFERYFKNRNLHLKSHFDFKYILFLESTIPTESNILPIIDKIISKNNKFSNIKVVYRPHPWRKSLKIYNQKDFENIIIDPQLKKNYSIKNFSTKFQPSLEYYSSLLKNAEFVISGPTSMIIESLIFRKVVLLLNFKIKDYLISPFNILKNFEHFKKIEKCSSVIKNNDIKNLEKDLLKCIKLNKNLNKSKIDKERCYFLTNKCQNYRDNLNKIISKLLN